MPSRWAASERPLFVRTVWVSGARHAILSPDDPAKDQYRPRRKPRTAPERRQDTPDSTLEDCLTNTSLQDKDERFSQRIYQWLESSGKIRPPTPFEGALWEPPREHGNLDVPVEPMTLTAKRLDLQLVCSGIPRGPGSPPLPPTPPVIHTFIKQKHPQALIPTCPAARPQLHIFMPLIVTRFDDAV